MVFIGEWSYYRGVLIGRFYFILFIFVRRRECLISLSVVTDERAVINKERASGAYRLSAYYLAKMTSELPLYLSLPLAFMTIVYWAAGLNGVASYFSTIGIILLCSISAQVSIIIF